MVEPALPVGIGRIELLDIPGRWGRVDAFGRGLVDVGTGAGDIPAAARALAREIGVLLRTIGIDVTVPIVRAAARECGCGVTGDARRLPFADRSVDVVTCSQVLHHFGDDEARTVIAELNRVARTAVIIGEIRRYLRDNTPIRVSRSLRDVAYKALQVRDQLTHRHGREPTVEEIARELGLPREEVVHALDAIQDPVSLFEPIYQDGGDPIYVVDQVSDDKQRDEQWLESIAVREAMSRLDEREQLIITKRFYQGKTQMEVANEIGISQAQVSRLEKAALQRMRKYM